MSCAKEKTSMYLILWPSVLTLLKNVVIDYFYSTVSLSLFYSYFHLFLVAMCWKCLSESLVLAWFR